MAGNAYKCAEPYYMEKQTDQNKEELYMEVVHNYIEYYHRRARKYKTWYLGLSVVKIFVLAAIPVAQAVPQLTGIPWIAAGASSVCLVLESVIGLFHMKDRWSLYRRTENVLMSEERQYAAAAGAYRQDADGSAFPAFVDRVESMINSEGSEWNQMILKTKEGTGGKS